MGIAAAPSSDAGVAGVQPAPAAEAAGGRRHRVEAVDVVRGVIMIIMALDHTRDYFAVPGQNPTDLATTTTALFFTRWITHICAPVFFLLTGTGAFLSLRRKSVRELSRFLFTRGVWLLVVEVVIMRCFAYQFNFDYKVTFVLTLWALGFAMITLAALVRLPASVVTAIGAVMIAAHNLLDGAKFSGPLWTFLHAPGFLLNTPKHVVFDGYPLIPWIGVTAVGFGLGQIYAWDAERRRTFLLRLGLALTVAFVAIRFLNVYGDPRPWAAQANSGFTALSFLNTTKQPPSLLFLLMTLGPAMLLLRAVDRGTPAWLRPAWIIGKVPLFYFFLHFALIHALAVVLAFARYGRADFMFQSPDLGNFPFTAPPGWGISLPAYYGVWMLVVLIMYPLCKWFAGVKQRRTDAWLSYV